MMVVYRACRNYKGMWVAEIYEDDKLLCTLEYVTKKALDDKIRELMKDE